MQPTAARPDRTLIIILSVIVAIVIVAVIVVFTRGGPTEFDPSTPEGVVQGYTNAVISEDDVAALGLLTSDIRENCDRTHPHGLKGLLMTIDSTKIFDDTAVVRVTMEQSSGGGLYGGSSYVYDERFDLVLEGNDWKLESTPWDLMMCYDQGDRK